MKKKLIPLFLALNLSTFIFADLDEGSVGLEKIDEPARMPGPFRLEGDFDIINSTHFDKKGFKDQKLKFSQFEGTASVAFCYIPKAKEAYAAGISYRNVNIDWDENPFFDQSHFNQLGFLLRFYSQRFCDWVWQGQFLYSIDTEHFNFDFYSTYDFTLWGKYSYLKNINLHMGIIIQTGMKLDYVYPILGFDWAINPCWTLNAVFPVNISIIYEYNKFWSGGIAVRFFDVRERTGRDEPLSMGLLSYKNSGVELAVLYNNDPFIEGNIHIGTTLGGRLRISDKENHHARNFNLDPSCYVGGEIIWSF